MEWIKKIKNKLFKKTTVHNDNNLFHLKPRFFRPAMIPDTVEFHSLRLSDGQRYENSFTYNKRKGGDV